jgi:hypothetical protein
MRIMMKVTVPNDGGNKAIKDGSIGKIIGTFMEEHKPESAYFYPENGERTAQFVVDVKDPSEIVALGETFFQTVNARVSFLPVMNAQDLRNGMEKLKV